ncbi:rho GTPase-activating protein 45-like isoform X1 [Bolinopsis microptera]|uniref:rho GTPase-activating protein 45-like n=1 Tax=Bolinopsis microptera TaxID=2820187 RepID=UPI003079EB71
MSKDVIPDVLSTHLFRRSRAPVRCRACENYVYLKGSECQKCGIVCHRKCLKSLSIKCGGHPLPHKVPTFGVDFSTHLCATHCTIPYVVFKCVKHIETTGMDIKGIYRVAGAKSKMQSLCRSFENGLDLVELNDKSPHLVSSVLKLYLRQLPEPLLLHSNYEDLIRIALNQQENGADLQTLLKQLHAILEKLPKANRFTLRFIVEHLNRISLNEGLNQMTSVNLGIVFGPTLIRPKHEHSSASIVHINHHSMITQLLIENPSAFIISDEESEYARYRENPKVASMSDVLPIKTRDSIKLFTQDEDYLDYIQSCLEKRSRRKASKLGRGYAGKTASEPNVLEISKKTRLVTPRFPGEGSEYVASDDSHTRIVRAFSEPSKCDEFDSQEYLMARSDLSNVSSDLSSTENLLDSTDDASFPDTDEDETYLQEYVAQQLHSVKARLQILRTYSLSTSDSDEIDGTVLNVKCVQSSQSEVSSDPYVSAYNARLVNLGVNQSLVRPRLSLECAETSDIC